MITHTRPSARLDILPVEHLRTTQCLVTATIQPVKEAGMTPGDQVAGKHMRGDAFS